MVKALALNSIHICREAGKRKTPTTDAVPAKIEEVQAGRIFDASMPVLAALPDGSWRKPTRVELATAGMPDEETQAAQKEVEAAQAKLNAAKNDEDRASASDVLTKARAKLDELTR